MDSSSLARDLDNLEKSWSSLDGWLNFWTILVVIGVAVELLVLIIEYAHGWREFKRGTIRTPDKPSIPIFFLGFLGVALVAIGVAGEFRIHIKAGQIESDMRSKSRELVGIADKEASEARKDAESAKLRAAELLSEIQPRELTLEQQRKIGDSLRRFAGRNVTVYSLSWDTEGYGLTKQIVAALKHALMDVTDRSGSFGSPLAVSLRGITVRWSASGEDAAIQMADALRVIGKLQSVVVEEGRAMIALPGNVNAPDPTPRLDVFVNPKPFEVIK